MYDIIEVNRSNYRDYIFKTLQLCASLSKHEKNTPLSPGEKELAIDIQNFLKKDIYFHSVVGLPEERIFFEELFKEAKKL